VTDKNRSSANRLNNLLRSAESNDSEAPLDVPEEERLESIRRQITRTTKVTKKLNDRLTKLLVDKDAQDKITWRLQVFLCPLPPPPSLPLFSPSLGHSPYR